MAFAGARRHLIRMRHQAGRRLRLGDDGYRVRGYFANRLATSLSHERNLLPVLGRLLASRTGTFIDVGVNVGQTLFKVLALDPTRPYVGFEPQVDCAFYVDQFLQDNALDHAQVIPLALSDTEGLLTLHSSRSCDQMASTVDHRRSGADAGRRSRSVVVRTGDAILSALEIESLAAIKIDVEGAEASVLRGFSRTLEEHRPPVLFEVLPNFRDTERVRRSEAECARNETAARQLEEILHGAEYQIFQIDASGAEHLIDRFDLDSTDGIVSSDYIAHAR